MNFRVLAGMPNSETEMVLAARFEELATAELVATRSTTSALLDAAGEYPEIDVVLIHQDLGPAPVFDAIRDLSHRHPQLAILLVSPTMDPDTFTGAMESGARGVLPDDSGIAELETRIGKAAEWSRTLRRHLESASLDVPASGVRGRIVVLSGAKGGVGTTTCAVHLAMAAAAAGRVVCLVDLDLQTGDLPAFLNLRHRRSISDLADAGDDISPGMLAETLYVDARGPHVLLAPEHGERGEDVDARATRRVLGALRSRYELVIVDCGSIMNDATAMAVELADSTVVTVTPDVPALRGAQRLMAMWERLQIRSHEDVFSLVTRHSRKNEIQPDFLQQLLGTKVLRTPVPAAYRALEPGENNGDPSKVTDEGLRKAFARLASELDLLNAPAQPGSGGKGGAGPTPPGGLTARLAARAEPQPSTRDVSGFLNGSGAPARMPDHSGPMPPMGRPGPPIPGAPGSGGGPGGFGV
ncbi:AAA family ATPase [Nocardiopsis sp. NRRL B-16309]|uniref:AAA family ATPase n=1 Tax=Nocardiopsis sp. NRRL B-16309 TaxID=1519494 RepID=UPI0006ADA835|nr:AAA family ATPase [Nocardiopsis sp. NRRL B-16309]KOX24193.1 septum formation initiator [Nocardiopsis sp. NRRL B-16309]